MRKTENTQKSQEILYQLRYLREQRDMFQNQLEIMNASYGNLMNTKMTLENLKNIKDNDEILVPIGGIINVKAQIKKPQKVLLYVNQDIVIEKDIDNSIVFIDKLLEKHQEQINYLRTQIQNLDINLQGISQSLQRGMQQQY